jgi:hypothetical protein
MNRREKLLAASIGLMVILFGSTKGVSKYQEAYRQNEKKLENVKEDLLEAKQAENRGLRAQNRLSDLGRLSLPTDIDIAVTHYEDWLRELLEKSNLEVGNLKSKTGSGPHKRSQLIDFDVSAQGTLAELSSFLHGFYQAGHLHRISETTLTPIEGEKALSIALTIEALSLDNCKREEDLTDRPSKIKLEPLDRIQVDIVGRNIFAVYNPPVTVVETPTVQFSLADDPVAAQALVSSMTRGQAGWQMSVRMKDSGKIHFFREGDPIAIGAFVGSITKLDGRFAIVTIGKERMQVRLGQNLSQAQPLADLAG